MTQRYFRCICHHWSKLMISEVKLYRNLMVEFQMISFGESTIEISFWLLFTNLDGTVPVTQTMHLNTGACVFVPLQWRHDKGDGVSNHRRLDCLLSGLFRRRSEKTSKLRVIGLCEGNPPVWWIPHTASNAENVSIWWRHHASGIVKCNKMHLYVEAP